MAKTMARLKTAKLAKKDWPEIPGPPPHCAAAFAKQVFLGATKRGRVPIATQQGVGWFEPGEANPRKPANAPPGRSIPLSIHPSAERCLVDVGPYLKAEVFELDLETGRLDGPLFDGVGLGAAYVSDDRLVVLERDGRGMARVQLHEYSPPTPPRSVGEAVSLDALGLGPVLRDGALIVVSGGSGERLLLSREGETLSPLGQIAEEPFGDLVAAGDRVYIVDVHRGGRWEVLLDGAKSSTQARKPGKATTFDFEAAVELLFGLPRAEEEFVGPGSMRDAVADRVADLGITFPAPAKRASSLFFFCETRELAITLYELPSELGGPFASALAALTHKCFARLADLAKSDHEHATRLLDALRSGELENYARLRVEEGKKPTRMKSLGAVSRVYMVQYDGE